MGDKEVSTDAAHADELRVTVMPPAKSTPHIHSGAYRLDSMFGDPADVGQFFRHHRYLRRLHFLLESRLRTRFLLTSSIYNFTAGGLVHLRITDNRPPPDRAFKQFMRKLFVHEREESPLPSVLESLSDAARDVEARLGSDAKILQNPMARERWLALQREIEEKALSEYPWTWTTVIGSSVLVAKTTQDGRIWSDSAAVTDAEVIVDACIAPV